MCDGFRAGKNVSKMKSSAFLLKVKKEVKGGTKSSLVWPKALFDKKDSLYVHHQQWTIEVVGDAQTCVLMTDHRSSNDDNSLS